MIRQPAHGALRGRVLAARCLEVSVRGMPPTTDPELVGRTLQVLQPLLLHPEPLVWVHAARALGRLTGPLEQLEGTLLDWVLGESPLLRQRAMTAFASLPGERAQVPREPARARSSTRPTRTRWVLARGRRGDAVPLLRAARALGPPRRAHPRGRRRRDRGARARARPRDALAPRRRTSPRSKRPLRALREMARARAARRRSTSRAAGSRSSR